MFQVSTIIDIRSPAHKKYSDMEGGDSGEAANELKVQLHSLTEEDLLEIVHKPGQLIRECRYDGKPHDACKQLFVDGRSRLVTPNMGVCYAFNAFNHDSNKEKKLRSGSSGQLSGLDLELYLDSGYNLMRGLSPYQGVKVLVHHPSQLPLAASQGHRLSVNNLHNIAVEQTHVERLPPPYASGCNAGGWGKNRRNRLTGSGYSEALCQSFCFDDLVQAECNCTALDLIEVDRGLSPPCRSVDSLEARRCVMRAEELLDQAGS